MAFILSLALDGGPDDAGLTDRNQSPFETGTDSKVDPMASAGPTSNSFISQRLKLHYIDWGNRGASPLLLVHGGRDHCRNWAWVVEMLYGYSHIIAPDLRGHGNTPWSPYANYTMDREEKQCTTKEMIKT